MILIVCIGKMKNSPVYKGLNALCLDYLKRVQPWWPIELIELSESKHTDGILAKAEEANRLKPYIEKARQTLLWREKGKLFTSPEWSAWLQRQQDQFGFSAANPWVWVIAGPSGPDDSIISAAHHHISLSGMTFPHLMARLLVLEQLYRGMAIAHHSAYHK